MSSESLILFFILGAVLVGGAIVFSSFVTPRSYNPQKSEPYECGVPAMSKSWMQFNVGYYIFAIIFLIFDVETVFIFPWALTIKSMGSVAYIEILIFFFILGIGLLYAWRKKSLKWE